MVKDLNIRPSNLGGRRFSSATYAENAIAWAADNSASTVAQMIRLGKDRANSDNIYSRIASQPKIAQIQALALQSAIYLVGAALLPGMPKPVAKEIYTCISDSLIATKLGPTVSNGMKMAFDIYGQSLFAQVAAPAEDVGFNAAGSPTANVMFDLLKEGYATAATFSNLPTLEVSALDGTGLKLLVDTAIAGQFKAFVELKLRYLPQN